MRFTVSVALLALVLSCGICHSQERWNNFAEDADVKYYLDEKSVTALPDNVYVFWVKAVAKDKEYYKREYNINNLSYILTNYELDCAASRYRVCGVLMFDKNRKELNKVLPPGGESAVEPIPPESMLELAAEEICSREGVKQQEKEEPAVAMPHAPASPAEPPPPAEPPSIQ